MDRETLKRIAQSPTEFRKHLIVPTSKHGPKRLGDILADYQRRDFEALDRAVIALVSGKRPEINRFWWERTKGGSKDSDLAVMVLWVIAFSPIGLTIQIAAADFDQASEMRKIMRQILALNPWLAQMVDAQATKIVSRKPDGSECTILSADAASSHGARPDWLICNELSHVGDEEFIQTLLDNAAKVPNGLVNIATNAGHLGSWQWNIRQTVIDNPRWHFSALMEPAPWIDRAELEERKKQTSPLRYARLWMGQWVAAEGDAFDSSSIDLAIKPDLEPMTGRPPHGNAINNTFDPMTGRYRGAAFGMGVDLGISRDHSAITIVCRQNGRFRLATVEVFTPTAAQPRVQLEDVQKRVFELYHKFGVHKIYFDPWQGEQLIQFLEKNGIPSIERFTLNPTGWDRICRNTIEIFNQGSIGLYPHAQLISQLRSTSVIEKTNGQLKFEWQRTAQAGHGDVCMSFTLALLAARDSSERPSHVSLPRSIGAKDILSRSLGSKSEAFEQMIRRHGFNNPL